MSLEDNVKRQKSRNRTNARNKKKPQVYNLIDDDSYGKEETARGERYSRCSNCNSMFEQIYYTEQDRFSNFKTCPDCRKKKSVEQAQKIKKKEKEVSVADLPYTPFEWQKEAQEAFENHRFIVLACGNRTGKDRLTIMLGIKYFVECLNENRAVDNPDMVPPVLWWQIAPTEKMAKQNWRELRQYFPKDWVVDVSDSSYTMQTVGGGIIEVRSGYDPENLVGVGLDLCTITEAARFKDLMLAWSNINGRLDSPGRGRMIDRKGQRYGQGKAIINSSPLGKNEFYRMFCYGQRGSADYSSEWWSAQYPWTANPINAELAAKKVKTKYGVITYEENLRRQLGERRFRSNYLGDFLAMDGSVFKKFETNCVVNPFDKPELNSAELRANYIEDWKKVIPFRQYKAGYDPATGSSGDSPFFVIRDMETNHIVRVCDLYGKSYEEQYDFIASMCKMYNNASLYWLRTGHTAIEGQFERRGVAEFPLNEQGENKRQLVQTLELVVENGDMKILMDGSKEVETLIYEMNDYTEKNGKYSNNEQPHDDAVSALYAVFSDYSVSEVVVSYCGLMGGV